MLFEVISLLICIGIPVLGGIYFAVKGKGYFLTFLTGILSFVVTQMILRIPLLGYLKTNWEWFMILPYSHYYIYMAIAAFSAGVFEETGRVVGLGVLRKGKTSWMDAVAFGLGHGGIEAVWIGVIGVLPNVLNEDSSISVVVLLSGAERFCAMAFHILLTLVIMEGIRRHKIVLLADRSSSAWIIRLFNCISEYNPDLGCSDFWGRGCDDSFDFYKTKVERRKGNKTMKKNMKKLAVGFGVFVMAVGSLMGCSSLGSGGNEQGEILKELPEGFDKETVRKQAMEDIEIAQSKDYESWKSRFTKDLQNSLTEESYDSYLKILEKQGEFKEFGKCTYLGQIKDNKKYGGVIIVVKYEEGNVNYSLAYDEDMNLVSFTM